MKLDKDQKLPLRDLSNCIRILAADAVEKAKSGHPGMPLGMADVMTVLAAEFLTFNPDMPKWFNRDRLVLSAGHGSMLLYAFYYLAGYKDFSLDDIKAFRQLHSKAAGHPECHMYEAIETTTGPLGQGFATAVGMAIAGKKYQQKLGSDIADYKVYAIVGDGCLMEGVSYEAASFSGHLNLNNLVVIFDDNGISIDGSTSLSVSEDHLLKFHAMGFETEAIDGHDYEQIRRAFSNATVAQKPYFIACKTQIGRGSLSKAGSEKSHGSPLGENEIFHLKEYAGFPQQSFVIPEELLATWRQIGKRGVYKYEEWQKKVNALDAGLRNYFENKEVVKIDRKNFSAPLEPQATRASSGIILQEIIKNSEKVIGGSADLSSSNNILNSYCKAISANNYEGNFLHYGVREALMGAVMNGLALSGFLPIGGTFFVFSDYMRPAIRLASIMKLPVIYVMTHDSIGVGEDGPTHQPVEHLASFRAMPGIKVFRPANFAETLASYEQALLAKSPSIMVLSRQNLEQLSLGVSVNVVKGGYIVSETDREGLDIVIFASGSEVSIALKTKEILEQEYLKKVRVVSVPCFENLLEQGGGYLQYLIGDAGQKVAIEAGSSFGWSEVIGNDGLFFGVNNFGFSAPYQEVYEICGLIPKKIARKVIENTP